MTFPGNSQEFESFLPLYETIPDTWEQAREFLIEYVKRNGNSSNAKEIGWFLEEELLSGKQFIPSTVPGPQMPETNFRAIFRKVIDFGALPAAGTKSIAHGIMYDANFTLIEMWLSATNPVGLTAFSLQYFSLNAADSIRCNIDATNANVTVTADYSAFTRAFIVLEYILEP